MAARKPDNQAKKSPPGQAQFVNINLTKEQQTRCKQSDWDMDRLDAALETLYNTDHKLSARYDAFNDCYAAWLIGGEKSVNKGLILAGRGSTPSKAIKQVIFIHFAILEGVWGSDDGRSRDEIDD